LPQKCIKKPFNVFANYYSTFNENIVKKEQIGENTIKTAFFLGDVFHKLWTYAFFFNNPIKPDFFLFKLPWTIKNWRRTDCFSFLRVGVSVKSPLLPLKLMYVIEFTCKTFALHCLMRVWQLFIFQSSINIHYSGSVGMSSMGYAEPNYFEQGFSEPISFYNQ